MEGFVYTLELQDDCYYVGFSTDVETRIASHFLGRGAQWTRLHAPISVLSVRAGDEVLENAITVALMAKHGWRNVRGGAYLSATMPCPPPAILKAFSFKPPPVLPESAEVETCHGHSVIREQIQDSGSHAWRARVSGSKAAAECPKRGYKTLYAGSKDELQATVETWLNES